MVLLLAGCSQPARPRAPAKEVCAEVPPCGSWIDSLREKPTTLHVHLVDRVGTECPTGAGTVTAVASFDGAKVGEASFACGVNRHVIRLEGVKVSPGLHTVVVRTEGPAGTLEATAVMSLPAFDVAGDGKTAVLGSEIIVDVGVEDLTIEPAQVYAPHDL